MKKMLLILTTILMLNGCGDKNKDYLVSINTSYGNMKVLLYDETPLHKKNFLKLAGTGKFDSTIFHRVIKDFMIQGGNIYEKDGTTEPESSRIPAEIVEGLYHKKGELAAARQGDNTNPDRLSSSCQFYIVQGKVWDEEELTVDQIKLNQNMITMLEREEFDSLKRVFLELQNSQAFEQMVEMAINHKDLVEETMGVDLDIDFDKDRLDIYTTVGGTPHLDGDYTVFGRVVEGLEVVDKISAVQTGNANRPLQPINMTMEVEKVNKKEITKRYGYQYPPSK